MKPGTLTFWKGVPPSMRTLPVLWIRDQASVHAGPNAYHLLNSGKAAYLEGCFDKLKFSSKGKPCQWSLVFLTLVLSAHVLYHNFFFFCSFLCSFSSLSLEITRISALMLLQRVKQVGVGS